MDPDDRYLKTFQNAQKYQSSFKMPGTEWKTNWLKFVCISEYIDDRKQLHFLTETIFCVVTRKIDVAVVNYAS